jgi:2-aminoadipate transaminase
LGDPPFSLLPQELIRQAAGQRLAVDDPAYLQYGAMQGDGFLRDSLAKFLTGKYACPIRPENMFITCGVSMGLHLACTLFTRPGDTVFVEEPTYFFALRILADHDLNLIPISTDENGLVLESLEENLSRVQPKFLYVVPVFQNPTGHTLSPERRRRLLDLARQRGFLIVADEVYQLLSYTGLPPRPFAADAEGGNVIALGSFSKILAPGLRLGWLHASSEIIQRFLDSGLLNSGGGMNPFTSAVVQKVVESGGLEQNIARLISTYRLRLKAMDASLRRSLPELHYSLPQGGYFFWARLPQGILAADLLARARTARVGFRPGTLFSSRGGMQEYIRLSFAFYGPEELEQGLLRLKQALR